MPRLTRAFLFSVTALAACAGPLITERKDEHGMTALMRAARAPDTILVAQLLAKGADPNAAVPPPAVTDPATWFSRTPEVPSHTVGYTPLHFATQYKRLDNARLLLRNGADATRRSRTGASALRLAIQHGDVEMTRLLARAGARPAPNEAGWAVAREKPELVTALFTNGANPNQATLVEGQKGYRPLLIIATQRGDPAIVRTLLTAGASKDVRDRNGWTALRWAHDGKLKKQARADEIIAILDSVGARDDAGLRALALADAVVRKDLAGVRAALKAGAEPDTRDDKGMTLLIHASAAGDTKVAQALIDGGANVNVTVPYAPSPLTAAIEKGDVKMVNVLLRAGARGDRVDGAGRLPLFLTVTMSRADIAALILADSTVRPGRTDLPTAASHSDSVMVHLLLDHGAVANSSALSAAARSCNQHDNTPVLRLLLARGAKPVDNPYSSALMLAAERCTAEALSLLIKAGGSLDKKDYGGATPLMYAVRKGRIDNAQVLLAAGADVNARDGRGMTAMNYARNADLRNALRAAGGVLTLTPEREVGLRGLLARLR
jgi:ankyrin repeat protein